MEDIKQLVFTIISNAINGKIASEDLKPEMQLTELGINSMTLISILFEIEGEVDVEIADVIEDMTPPETIEEIINFVFKLKEA